MYMCLILDQISNSISLWTIFQSRPSWILTDFLENDTAFIQKFRKNVHRSMFVADLEADILAMHKVLGLLSLVLFTIIEYSRQWAGVHVLYMILKRVGETQCSG